MSVDEPTSLLKKVGVLMSMWQWGGVGSPLGTVHLHCQGAMIFSSGQSLGVTGVEEYTSLLNEVGVLMYRVYVAV